MAEAGELPTLVFLHHFGGSGRTWDDVAGRLRGEFTCLTPDLRGFGDANTAPGPYTIDSYADDVAGLVHETGLRRYILVGHSMGGKIALAFAGRRAKELAGLVLLAPSPPTPEPMSEEDRAAMLAGYGDREFAMATIAKITAHALPDAVANRTADDMLRSAKAAWTSWLAEGSRADIAAAIDGIAVPTLVVSGVEDRAIPSHVQSDETLPRLAEGRLLTVTGTGHLLPLEAPELVADLIGEHGRGIGRGTSRPAAQGPT